MLPQDPPQPAPKRPADGLVLKRPAALKKPRNVTFDAAVSEIPQDPESAGAAQVEAPKLAPKPKVKAEAKKKAKAVKAKPAASKRSLEDAGKADSVPPSGEPEVKPKAKAKNKSKAKAKAKAAASSEGVASMTC